jgi:hypothetical protein
MKTDEPGRSGTLEDMPIVGWAPHFDETSGGIIVLHLLAYRLREMGLEV